MICAPVIRYCIILTCTCVQQYTSNIQIILIINCGMIGYINISIYFDINTCSIQPLTFDMYIEYFSTQLYGLSPFTVGLPVTLFKIQFVCMEKSTFLYTSFPLYRSLFQFVCMENFSVYGIFLLPNTLLFQFVCLEIFSVYGIFLLPNTLLFQFVCMENFSIYGLFLLPLLLLVNT